MSAAVTETFHAASMDLDSRFIKNQGGDGTNEASRQIYELFEYFNDSTPDMVLEMWTDSTEADKKLRGSLIMHGNFNGYDQGYMGFVFGDKENAENYDGLRIKVTPTRDAQSSAITGYKFEADDLWTAKGDDAGALTADSADSDWTVTESVPASACDSDSICTFKASFSRSFKTSDANDYEFEHGMYRGYELFGFYELSNSVVGAGDPTPLKAQTEALYILMGAYSNCAALLAVVTTYIAMAF